MEKKKTLYKEKSKRYGLGWERGGVFDAVINIVSFGLCHFRVTGRAKAVLSAGWSYVLSIRTHAK